MVITNNILFIIIAVLMPIDVIVHIFRVLSSVTNSLQNRIEVTFFLYENKFSFFFQFREIGSGMKKARKNNQISFSCAHIFNYTTFFLSE